jgi:phosphoglycolate phosphatase-like HAD superfamily hydrolase
MLELSAKGVVWDLDGTLLNSFRLHEDVLTDVLVRRTMVVPPHEVFVKNYHGRLRDSIQAISGTDGSLLEELYEDFIQSEEHHYKDPTTLYFPDALDLLQRSHSAGLRQIIISNRPHYSDSRLGSPRNLAKKSPLAGLVELVVCGDDSELHKPDAHVLDAAERSLGLKRSELVVVGDQFVDAEFAHNLGVPAVLVARDGADIPHLDTLHDGWQEHVTIVGDLREVSIVLAQDRA